MTGRAARRARHAWKYPPEERGRRIRWRTVTFALYAALAVATGWISHNRGWSDDWFPPKWVIGVVAVPYWAVVIAVWRSYGPYLPGLHDERPGTSTSDEPREDR